MAFTPEDGRIDIFADSADEFSVIPVSDTDIAPEQQRAYFGRCYIGRENKNEGSRLGQSIDKLTTGELGGSIAVQSVGFRTMSKILPRN